MRARCLIVALSCLIAATAHARPLTCPQSRLDELHIQQPLPGLLNLVPPLALLHALNRDRLADLPRRPVAFRVVDEAGKAVPNALVGIIHRKSERFLAEGAAGGPSITLPHGEYAVNAAIAAKDGSVRFGSTEIGVDAKGPATVTVRLTGRADAAVAKPLAATAPVATRVTVGFDSALRESAVVAVARQGSNLRAKEGDEQVVLSQFGMKDSPTIDFLLPGRVGKYDVVAMLCAPRVPLLRWSVATTPVEVAIDMPDRVPVGSTVRVTLSGAISSAATASLNRVDRDSGRQQHLLGDKRQVSFDIGYEPGPYQIVVMAHDQAVLARRPFAVAAREIVIDGPDKVPLGGPAAFTWEGNNRARLEAWSIADGKTPARRLSTVSEKRLIAPPGPVELRLVEIGASAGEGVIARRRITIEGQAFAAVPREAVAGSRIDVRMNLDVAFFDRLAFYRRGASGPPESGLNRSRDPRVMDVRAPSMPGDYDLVFMLGSVHDKIEVARVPVAVRAP